MSSIRTLCPQCHVVVVGVPDVLLRRRDDRPHVEAEFDCPGCSQKVTQLLSERIVPVLVDAGCRFERYNVLSDDLTLVETAEEITEHEIAAFLAAMDHPSWPGELSA